MKPLSTWATIAITAYMAVTISACSKTSNSDDPASTPTSACNASYDGTLRDQYGRTCSNYNTYSNSCVNARFNAATNSYVDITTGQPVYCNTQGFTGTNTVPFNGTNFQGQSFSGCQGWTAVYGANYIPVDLGNGQLVCANMAYLSGYYPQIAQQPASYYYSQPIYTCSGYDCYGGGGGYYGGGGGGGYYGGGGGGCSTAISLSFYSGDSGASGGVCF